MRKAVAMNGHASKEVVGLVFDAQGARGPNHDRVVVISNFVVGGILGVDVSEEFLQLEGIDVFCGCNVQEG